MEVLTILDSNLAMNMKPKAHYYLEGLGGKENIKDVTNCTTRLRLTVNDETKVEDSGYFTHEQMSHGLVKSGKMYKSLLE